MNCVYLLKKRCRVNRKNHKPCDAMGFWDDGTGKLETWFGLLIFKTFSLRRTFQSIVLRLVLSCVIKTCTLYKDKSTFLCVPEIQWVVSFIVCAF